jgi:REP element-mobilizing transposase RayT
VKTALANASAVTNIRILEQAVLADHVHVLVSFRPDSSLSDFVRLAKSGAAYRANHVIAGAIRWARGFYAQA